MYGVPGGGAKLLGDGQGKGKLDFLPPRIKNQPEISPHTTTRGHIPCCLGKYGLCGSGEYVGGLPGGPEWGWWDFWWPVSLRGKVTKKTNCKELKSTMGL